MTLLVKRVSIPEREEHEGHYGMIAVLPWVCPVCGGPRGNIKKIRSYDGSRILFCDGWENPCGHVDKYKDARSEHQFIQNHIKDKGDGTIEIVVDLEAIHQGFADNSEDFFDLWNDSGTTEEFYAIAAKIRQDITLEEFKKGWETRAVLVDEWEEAIKEFKNILLGNY